MPEKLSDLELRNIVDNEVRSAMGELTGDLANHRAILMDYYIGENSGRLAQNDPDRSSVILTTVRDTVEWMMPQLMRMFARPDAVVEFEPVGPEDEEAAKQETQAINHIFWRQNEGFLILYTWFKDALLQKNGIVKFWPDESEKRSREEYDGLTALKVAELEAEEGVEAIEAEPSETKSINGEPLFRVVFERVTKQTQICVEPIPPEEFLISADARSLDLNGREAPRFVGHYTERTESQLREEGFTEDQIELMKRGADRWWDEYDAEDQARYHLSDEQEVIHGEYEGHESQRKIHIVEAYITVDRDGDGYAELLKVTRAGDFVDAEPADLRPFAALTPVILSHKFFGQSIAELMVDLQEIATATMRSVLDNMYLTNNYRPVANDRVDVDSLLVTRPGAPVYIEDELPVGDALGWHGPPAMWKEGLEVLTYLDTIRKDRTGVGDETMGLDPSTLATANTGVVLQAMEAAQAKIELVARVFADTGIKWLFRGIHELARKTYDQPLRMALSGRYVEVNPQEWRQRDDLTVNVGTATGNTQQELFALRQIGEAQFAMLQNGGLGVTVLPSQIYETGKRMAEALGQKDGDLFFFDPTLLQDPQIAELVRSQIPQSGPDPQSQAIAMTAQVEQLKVQQREQESQRDAQLKQAEIIVKREELAVKRELEAFKQQLSHAQARMKDQTESERVVVEAKLKEAELVLRESIARLDTANRQQVEAAKQQTDMDIAELRASVELAKAGLSEVERLRVEETQRTEQAVESSANTQSVIASIMDKLEAIQAKLDAPTVIHRDADGKPKAVGDRPVSYNQDGSIAQIG